MKLSELVAYRNHLNELSVQAIQRDTNIRLDVITHLVESQSIQLSNISETLKLNQHEVNHAFDNYNQTIKQLKIEIDKLIDIEAHNYFVESYRMYKEEELVFPSDELILNRTMNFSTSTLNTMRSRINLYSSWKYPGIIIRPGKEDFIDNMVMFDPLYLIDLRHSLIQPALDKFTPEYRNRVRPYIVSELSDDPILGQIPNGQFGICLAYNFFNYRPFEAVKRYLTEIYQKLKPGGMLLMTFNDCDRDKAVILVERHGYSSYTPGTLVRNLAESIGYEIVFRWDDGGPSTWIELKKPGELTSLRGGQTLAKIVHGRLEKSK